MFPSPNSPSRDQKRERHFICLCRSPTQQPRRVSTGATRSSSVGMGAPSPQGSGASSLPQDFEPDHREHLLRPSVTPVTPVPPAVSQSARARAASRLPPGQNPVEARLALNALITSRSKAYAGLYTLTPARTHAHIHANTHTPTPTPTPTSTHIPTPTYTHTHPHTQPVREPPDPLPPARHVIDAPAHRLHVAADTGVLASALPSSIQRRMLGWPPNPWAW